MFTEVQASAYKSALVRFYQGNKVIGAGLYFSHGYILTCAHIATQSLNLGKKPQEIALDAVAGKLLKVDFPFIAPMHFQEAEVVPSLWRFSNEDLAILKIEASPEDALPLTFPTSTYYRSNHYHVCGFPDGHPNGLWTQGVFLDEQAKGWVQIEDTKAQGVPIEPGFSGAPVWDEQLGGLAGITVARDQDRDEAKVGFMISYQKLKPALEAIALFDLLLPEADNLAPHWQKAYRFVRPEISRETYPSTLQAAILQVQNTAPQGRNYRAIEQFIGYLTLPELGLRIQPRLFQWLEKQVVNLNALLEAVRQKKEAQQARQSVVSTPHVLFWVQEELNSDRYSVQAYLVCDREQYDPLSATQLTSPAFFLEQAQDEKVNCQTIEQILRECLEESVATLPKENGLPSITVNVFLPLSCIGWDVDRWAADEQTPYTPVPEPIGSRYHIVLRIAERLNRQIPSYHQMQGKWSEKWSLLNQIQANPACERLICGRNETPQTLSKKLSRRNDAPEMLGFYLVDAPTPFTNGNSSLFPILIGSGAPLAIWLRQDLPDDYRQVFNQLLASCLAELSLNIQGLRQEADQEDDDGATHVGQHIGFIWEDPKLVPPVAAVAARLRMSA